MDKKSILTESGLARLKKKLASLIKKRKQLVVDLEATRQMGDLAENSAYHSLRNQLVILENQIDDLTEIVESACVVKVDKGNGEKIGLGSKVKVTYNGLTKEFEIVGDGEANPLNGQISFSSPIAQALLGRKRGEEARVETPGGETVYQILSVES